MMRTSCTIVLLAGLLLLKCEVQAQSDKCKPTPGTFIGTVYHTDWESVNVVPLTQKRLVEIAKLHCMVEHFHGLSKDANVQIDAVTSVNNNAFDVRVVLVRRDTKRSDTIAFARGDHMRVNGRFVLLDIDLLRYVAQRLPYYEALQILAWIDKKR